MSKIYMAVAAMFFIALMALGWRARIAKVAGSTGLVFILMAFWAQSRKPPNLKQYENTKAEYQVMVVQDPEIRQQNTKYLSSLKTIDGIESAGVIIVNLPKYPEFSYGDKLVLEGKLKEPSDFDRKDNASGILSAPKIISSEAGNGNPIKSNLYSLKHYILRTIGRLLAEPHAGLLGGLLLGTRSMPDDLLAAFRTTGTTHIIAVSGFNVTIIASFLNALLKRLGRGVAFYGSVLGIAGFVVITGASASVVRAGIMGSLGLVATHNNRIYGSANALILTSSLMLLQNPSLLRFDIGFQLSFAALAGLLFVQPKLEEYFPNAPKTLVDFLFPTLAAQISTTGIILYHFGNLSLISVFANMLILPVISITMFAGAVCVAISWITPSLGQIASVAPLLLLTYIIEAAQFTAKIPAASINEIKFPLALAFLYYLILGAFILWKPKPKF